MGNKFSFILFTLFLMTTANAATSLNVNLDVQLSSSLQVENSRLHISGTSPAPGRVVQISLDPGTIRGITYKLATDSTGHFEGDLAFAYGAGTYHVLARYSALDSSEDSFRGVLKSFSVVNTDQSDESYLLGTPHIEVESLEVANLVNQILADPALKTDFQKVRAIHDWVAAHITYNYAQLENPLDQTALDTLKLRNGICYQYSMLFAAVSRAAGFRTKVVNGTAVVPKGIFSHAWNEVWVDGRWVIVDTTWDAGTQARQKFFDPSAALFALDHTKTHTFTEQF